MIPLTKLDGAAFYLNPALIVTLEETPDTVVHLHTGTSIMVREAAVEIVELIIGFQRAVADQVG